MQVISPGTGCYGKLSSIKSIFRRGCPPVAIGESHRGLIHDRAPPLRAAPDARGIATSRSSTGTRCRSVWVSLVEFSG